MTNPAPTVVKHYQLVRQIGSGGMSDVYLAQDRRDGSEVVVKLLRNVIGDDTGYRERFEREAHVGALLRSPFTVHLLDFGRTADGQFFLVTEYVDGGSLLDALRAGPMEPKRAVRIAAQIARALEEAQARGVIHRDIKPANVMLTAGDSVKVLDFGIARQEGALTITVPGSFIGTANYAAPEASFGETDMRSDIYSLGATLYHMLAGQPPFSGDLIQVLRQHREATVNLNALGSCPEEVIDIVRKCMAKNPDDRYQSASQLAGALEHASRIPAAPPQPAIEAGATIIEPAGGPPAPPPPPRAADPATNIAPLPQEAGTAYTMLRPPVPAAPVPPAGPATSGFAAAPAATPVDLTIQPQPGAKGRYELRIAHASPAPLHLLLSASGEGLVVQLPGSVLAPAGTTRVPLEVRAAGRRFTGGRRTLPFLVHASGAGAEPRTAQGLFEDQPSGARIVVPVVGGLALLAAAISVPLLLAGGGDEAEGGEPSATATADAATATATGTAIGGVGTPTAGESELAFVVSQDHFARAASDGGNVVESDVRGFNTNWSADGSAVVYEANLTGDFEVWLSTKERPEAVNLSNHPTADTQPAISPDGSKVAYTAVRDGNAEIYVQDVRGGGAPVNVTRNAATDAQAAWSPDGRQIAFASERDGNFEIYVMDADGANPRNLSNSTGKDFQPQWSADGKRIVYYSDRDGNWEIYAANVDGGQVTRLTSNGARDEQPTFAPDGRIVFVSDRGGTAQLYSMAGDGSDVKQLTNVAGGAAWPRVVPKGAVAPGNPAAAAPPSATAAPTQATTAPTQAPAAPTPTRAAPTAPTATPTQPPPPPPSMTATQFCLASGCFPPGATVGAAQGGCQPSGMTGYATYTNIPAGTTIVARWARSGTVLNESAFVPNAASGDAFSDLFANASSPLVPGTYFLSWLNQATGLALATGTITLSCG